MAHPDLHFIDELIAHVAPFQRFGLGVEDKAVADLNKATVDFMQALNKYKKHCEEVE